MSRPLPSSRAGSGWGGVVDVEDLERAPGWYPDPRDPQRHRHWDGRRWSELSSSVPFWGEEDGQRRSRGVGGPPDRRLLLALAAVAVVVALALVWMLVGRDGGDGGSDTPTTTTPTTTTVRSDDASESPAPTAPDATSPTTPSPTDDAPPSTEVADPTAPCDVDPELLALRLREYPPLASLAAELQVADVKCAGRWATAVVSTPSTDTALAVFDRRGEDWGVLLVGSEEPCTGLGIDPAAEAALGCDFQVG